MRKCKVVSLIFLMGVVFSLTGCQGNNKENSVVQTFSEWTDNELFQEIPALITENTRVGELRDVGGEHYTFDIDGTELSDYWEYLDILEEAGFIKYADNGSTGLDDSVYTTTFTKEDLSLTVTHLDHVAKTYIRVGKEQPLSERMIYKESYKTDDKSDANTTMTMLEVYDWGNSFVIQLKNGHFVLNDGGMSQDFIYLIEYMESLVPAGEKPVVEGWFFSHAHDDHTGLFVELENVDYAKRLSVEGFYFSETNLLVSELTEATLDVEALKMACGVFKTSEGESTPMYRMATGERYYFSDITVDVLFTQEQFPLEDTYNPDLNDASTWLLYTIEGQTVLIPGDANVQPARRVLEIYDKEKFTVDILAAFHHGHNIISWFAETFTSKTVLYTLGKTKNERWTTEYAQGNALLQKTVAEYMSYGDGGKIFTFPYTLGTYESLPLQTWAHHPERNLANLNQPDRWSLEYEINELGELGQ